MTLRDEANALSETLVQLRRAFHQHPEPSLQEHRTARRIEEELDKLGIPHRRFGETGVFGVLNGTGTGSGIVPALPVCWAELCSWLGIGLTLAGKSVSSSSPGKRSARGPRPF